MDQPKKNSLLPPLAPLGQGKSKEEFQAHYESLAKEMFEGYQPIDRYRHGNTMDYELSKDSDREVIIEEAAAQSKKEGIRNLNGEWVPSEGLDTAYDYWFGSTTENEEDTTTNARTVGFSEAVKPLTDMFGLKDEDAQEWKNLYEKLYGYSPTAITRAFTGNKTNWLAGALFKQNGFVPVWDGEQKKMVMQEVGVDRKELPLFENRLLSAYGTTSREKNWMQSFFGGVISNVHGMGTGIAHTGVAVDQLFKGFDGSGEDNYINRLADHFSTAEKLNRISDYAQQDQGTFSDMTNFTNAFGQGVGSLIQFGSLGGVARGVGSLTVNLGSKVLAGTLTKKGAVEAAKLAAKNVKLANLLGNATGGMVINTGYIMKEAQDMGLPKGDAAALALSVGALATAIETGLGTNRLNNWLIGSKGGATKQMMEAIAREAGGNLDAASIQAAMNEPGVLSKIAKEFIDKIPVVKQVVNGTTKVGKQIGATRIGKAFQTANEEGLEEFSQSMIESTGKYIYDQYIAPLDAEVGAGKFGQRNPLDKENFMSAFEEYAMGALVGGATTGMMHNESNEDRTMLSYVANGQAGDILTVMKSMRDTGVYTEEQYQHYSRHVGNLEKEWNKHSKDILKAYETAQKGAGLKDKELEEWQNSLPTKEERNAAAFQGIMGAIRSRKEMEELQNELAEAQADTTKGPAEAKKISDLKEKINKQEALTEAYESRITSYKDPKKADFSREMHDYELELNFRKAATKGVVKRLKADISELMELRKAEKPGTNEFDTIQSKIDQKQETLMELGSTISKLEEGIADIMTPSFKQSFKEKMMNHFLQVHQIQEAADIFSLRDGYRLVQETESLDDLVAQGHDLIKTGNGNYITDALEIVGSKPKPKPKPKKEKNPPPPPSGKKNPLTMDEDPEESGTFTAPGEMDFDDNSGGGKKEPEGGFDEDGLPIMDFDEEIEEDPEEETPIPTDGEVVGYFERAKDGKITVSKERQQNSAFMVVKKGDKYFLRVDPMMSPYAFKNATNYPDTAFSSAWEAVANEKANGSNSPTILVTKLPELVKEGDNFVVKDKGTAEIIAGKERVIEQLDGEPDTSEKTPPNTAPVNLHRTIYDLLRDLPLKEQEAKKLEIYKNYKNLMESRRAGKAMKYETFDEWLGKWNVLSQGDTYIFGTWDMDNGVFVSRVNSAPTSKSLLRDTITAISGSGLDVISLVPEDVASKFKRSGYSVTNNGYNYDFKGEKMVKFAAFSNPKIAQKLFGKPVEEVTGEEIEAYAKEASDKGYENSPVEISAEAINQANGELNAILETYLSHFGIEVQQIADIQKKLGVDSMAFADILNKVAFVEHKEDLPAVAGEFIAYMMQYNPLVKHIIQEMSQTKEYSKLDKDEYFKVIGKLIAEDISNKLEGNYSRSLVDKIRALIDEFLAAIKVVPVDKINKNIGIISNNVIQQNKLMITANPWKPGAYGKTVNQISIESALKKDKFGARIISKLNKAGFILTGSTALAEQGTIQRPDENPLHDIDFVSPFSREETLAKFKEAYPEHAFVREVLNDDYATDTYVIAPVGYTVENLTTESFTNKDGVTKVKLTGYDIVSKSGKVKGTFRLVNVEGKSKPDEVEEGIKGKVLDFFSYSDYANSVKNPHVEYTTASGEVIKLANWKEVFKAKLQYARLKDLWDYNRFHPLDSDRSNYSGGIKSSKSKTDTSEEVVQETGNELDGYPKFKFKVPKKKKPSKKETVKEGIFTDLFLHKNNRENPEEAKLRAEALRDPNLHDNIRYEMSNQFLLSNRQKGENQPILLNDGTGSGIFFRPNLEFVGVRVYHKNGAFLGMLENPYKYTFGKDANAEPIIFADMTWNEFQDSFHFEYDMSPERFKMLQDEQRKLIDLRKALDKVFIAEKGMDKESEMKLQKEHLPMRTSFKYLTPTKKEAAVDLRHSQAKDADGDYVVYDTLRRKYVTGKKAPAGNKPPKHGEGSRYKAFMQVGSAQLWLDVAPKQGMKDLEIPQYIEELNELFQKVAELPVATPKDSKVISDLQDALNSKFISLEKEGLYVKFRIQLVDFKGEKKRWAPYLYANNRDGSKKDIRATRVTILRNFGSLQGKVKKLIGVQVTSENFKTAIPDRVKPSDSNANLFTTFNSALVIEPSLKVDLDKVDLSTIEDSVGSGRFPLLQEGTKETVPETIEAERITVESEEEALKQPTPEQAFQALLGLQEDEVDDDDLKFQRIPGLRSFNSQYIVNWIAAHVAHDTGRELAGTKKIEHYLKKYMEGLTLESIGVTSENMNEPEYQKRMLQAARELRALRNEDNRSIVINEVKKKYTSFMPLDELTEEADNAWNRSPNEAPAKISEAVTQFLSTILVHGTDHYGRKSLVLADGVKLHNKFLHNLSNTVNRAEMEKRMEKMALYDPEVRAVLAALNKMGSENPLYTGFYSNYMLFRLPTSQVVITDEVQVYNGIQRDSSKILLERWREGFYRKARTLSSDKREEMLDLLDNVVEYMEVYEEESTEENIEANRQSLEYLGESLTPEQQELLQEHGDMGPAVLLMEIFKDLGVDLPLEYADISVKGGSFGDVKFLTTKELGFIRYGLNKWDIDGNALLHEDGQLGTFRIMAENAVNFTSDVYEKTFKDAEKKTRYAYVSPSYILQAHYALMTEGKNENSAKAPHNYLMQLAEQLGPEVLSGMEITLTGDIRYGEYEEGSTFKNNTKQDFMMNRHAIFNFYLEKGSNVANYQPFVVAEKSSSFATRLPVDFEMASRGEVTDHAVQKYFDSVFQGEYNRLVDMLADPDVIKAYNSMLKIMEDRKPFAFLTSLNDNTELIDAMFKAAKEGKPYTEVEEIAKNALRPVLEQIVDENYQRMGTFPEVRKMNRSIYDKGFREHKDDAVEVVDKQYSAIYALNDTLVRIAYTELIQGDAAITKNEIDRVKRASGLAASGKAVIGRDINVAYVTDINMDVTGDQVNRSEDDTFESATDDAIVRVTPRYRMEMQRHMGELTPEQEAIWEKVIEGKEPITDEESDMIDLNSAKTVYYTPEVYNKKSDMVLTRALTSVWDGEKFIARNEKVAKLHNMLNWMEANNIDQVITWNATKGQKHDAIDHTWFEDGNFDMEGPVTMRDVTMKKDTPSKQRALADMPSYFASTILDGQYERKQLENQSKSKKGKYTITHPSQIIELIAAELRDMEGQPKVAKLIKQLDRLRKDVLEENVKFAVNVITKKDEDGNLDIGDWVEKTVDRLIASKENEDVVKYLISEDGEFKFSLNMPHMQKPLEQIMMSHTNKGVLVEDMPGGKVTIMPGVNVGVIFDRTTGEDIDPLEVEANPLKYANQELYGARGLKLHGPDADGNTSLAEIMITKKTANLMGLKLGDQLPPEALEIFGVRIPSQWYHSMIAAKVVGFLPDIYGDVAALPPEMPLIAGEDFDVDARYLMIKQGYWKDLPGGGREYRLYGSAKNMSEQWDEYYMSNTDRKEISIAVKRMKRFDPRMKELREKLQQIREYQSEVRNEKIAAQEDLEYLQEYLEQDFADEVVDRLVKRFGSGNIKKEDWQKAYIEEYQKEEAEVEEAGKLLGEKKNEWKKAHEMRKGIELDMVLLVEEFYREALERYGLIGTLQDFMETGAQRTVVPAAKNAIIDTYIKMFTHKSIQDRLKVPASVDRMKNLSKKINGLWGNLDEKGNVKESSHMLVTPEGMMDAWWNNVSGAANIANVAATNVVVAYATKTGLETSFPIVMDGKEYGSFSPTREDDYQGNEIMTETEFKWDSISTMITAMTDNAKERLAAQLNMGKQFVSLATVMLGMGVGFYRTMLFFNQPVLRNLNFTGGTADAGTINAEIGRISHKIEAYVKKRGKKGMKKNGIGGRMMEKAASYNEATEGGTKWTDIMDKKGEDMNIQEINLLLFQRRILLALNSLNKTSSGLFNLQNVLNTKKGFSEVGDAVKVIESHKALVSDDLKERIFLNSKTIMEGDLMVKSYLRSTKKIMKAWGEHMFSLSPRYLQMYDQFQNMPEETLKEMTTFITMQAFNKMLSDNGTDLASHAFLLYPEVDGGDTLVKMFYDMKDSIDEFRVNDFVMHVFGKSRRGSNISILAADNFAKMVSAMRDNISDGFDELWNGSKEEKRFARYAMMYLIQKDNFEYRSESFASFIDPKMFKGTLTIMDQVQKDLGKNNLTLQSFRKRFDQMVEEYQQNRAILTPWKFRNVDTDVFGKLAEVEVTGLAGERRRVMYLDSELFDTDKHRNAYTKLGYMDGDTFVPYKYVRMDNAYNENEPELETTVVYELLKFKVDPETGKYQFAYKEVQRASLNGQAGMHLSPEEIYELAPYTVPMEGFRSFDFDESQLEGWSEPEMEFDESQFEGFEDSLPDGDYDDAFGDGAGLGLGEDMEEDGYMDLDPDELLEDYSQSTGLGLGLGMDEDLDEEVDETPKFQRAPIVTKVTEEALSDGIPTMLTRLATRGANLEQTLEALFEDSPFLDIAKKLDEMGIKLVITESKHNAFGIWNPKEKSITLNAKMINKFWGDEMYTENDLEYTIAHEMIHALIDNMPANKKAIMKEELSKFMKDLEKHKGSMSQEVRDLFDLAKEDHEELLTYAFSSTTFAEFLAGIESDVDVDGSKIGNMWKRLKKIILDRIPASLKKNKLEELSDIMDTIMPNTDVDPNQLSLFDGMEFNDLFQAAPKSAVDIDAMIESGMVKLVNDETGKPCMANGGTFGFKKGGTWKIVKEFKGKSHAQGGIDISVDRTGVKMTGADGAVKAENGMVISSKYLK